MEYISLTEAMTLLVSGRSMTASELREAQSAALTHRDEAFLQYRRAAEKARLAAGLGDDWTSANLLTATGIPSECISFLRFNQERLAQEDQEVARWAEAFRTLKAAGKQGTLVLYGHPEGKAQSEELSRSTVAAIIMHPTLMDAVVVRVGDNFAEWHELRIESTAFKKWNAGQTLEARKAALPIQKAKFDLGAAEKDYLARVATIGEGKSSEAQDIAYMQARHGLARPAIRKLREKHGPDHWKKGGRPKTSPTK